MSDRFLPTGRTKREMQRLTYTMWVQEAMGRGPNSKLARIEKQAARDYLEWVAHQVCDGKRVELHGIGTIWMTLRKGRKGVGTYRVDQPDQYVLKIKPSVGLKERLKQLAVEYPDPKELPGNRGNRVLGRAGKPRSERDDPRPKPQYER